MVTVREMALFGGIVISVVFVILFIMWLGFMNWSDTRLDYSCQELRNMHFRFVPEGCV